MAKTTTARPKQPDPLGSPVSVKARATGRSNYPKSTPESAARKVLMLERARQRTRIRQMQTVCADMAILDGVLRRLLTDPAFVALLRREGFLTIPRQLRDRLGGMDVLVTTPSPSKFLARTTEPKSGQTAPAGICPEALKLLADYRLPDRTIASLRRMVPLRQLAAAKVMADEGSCSGAVARALLAATPASLRADDPRGRQSHPEKAILLARLEKGLVGMQEAARSLTPRYHDDLYCRALTASHVRGWMRDVVVRRWLRSHCPGDAGTLEQLVEASESATVPKRPMKLPYLPANQEKRR